MPLRRGRRMRDVSGGDETRPRGEMGKRSEASCSDCYFRRAGLCALPGDSPCPTFRLATAGALTPPRQPRLVPLPAPAYSPAAA